jgi:tetratricopeptide (TPR) repeat protein
MTQITREPFCLPTYGLGAPEINPAFFEKRVYQGSSGKVYPVPFIDRVHDHAEPKVYDSVRIENGYVRLVILPEIGGRIFLAQDKSNADYDFFYRQDVIKPALVGLAGPWISGGVEFNWPQHHRPGTFMPADVAIDDGEGTPVLWLSEHDPLNRLKGTYGIVLHPESCLIELRARVFNRTPLTQTFLWWANAAVRVHDAYQSFFPPDVHFVADHAVRAMSSFPVARNTYYGVEYTARPGRDDLRCYQNIPVPTSYMVLETLFSFFGGYDFDAEGGFVHVADRHVAPGKKQWTWGNHAFGHAWDRELTDSGGPYAELMAGVYTDNQPDFSYLLPYETKTFSQFWWPYRKLGPVQNATKDAALRLVGTPGGSCDLGVVVSARHRGARVVLARGDTVLLDDTIDVAPDVPWQRKGLQIDSELSPSYVLRVFDGRGNELLSYRPVDDTPQPRRRELATEPAPPHEVASNDELVLIAEHLEQYRHPTRDPEAYLQEALRRDAGDSRALTALGARHLRRGEFRDAESFLRRAIARLTSRHPNPVTGEAHYLLGVCLARQGQDRLAEAYDALSKATWNYEWRAAAHYELATIDGREWQWTAALQHLEQSLDGHRLNVKAETLKACILNAIGRGGEALASLDAQLRTDPLHHWARFESEWSRGLADAPGFLAHTRNDAQTVLDVAFEYADAGLHDRALAVLDLHHRSEVAAVAVPNPSARSPMTRYARAWILHQKGDQAAAEGALREAGAEHPDYFFPSRLHEQIVLEWARATRGDDHLGRYGLGNLYYDKRRHREAIDCWQEAVTQGGCQYSVVHRNLGIAAWNINQDGAAARQAYERALGFAPRDARLVYEFDQLRKKLNEQPAERIRFLEAHAELLAQRDDATVELATLFNITGQPDRALALLEGRRFHPWEGGEGQVLRQYKMARLQLGCRLLETGQARAALEHFARAMDPPETLGEAWHLLQARADMCYFTGMASRHAGENRRAERSFQQAVDESGDFQRMAVVEHSEMSYCRGLALLALGRPEEAHALFAAMKTFAEKKAKEPATIDYFATSLPLLLVFDEDLERRNCIEATYLLGLAHKGFSMVALAKQRAWSDVSHRDATVACEAADPSSGGDAQEALACFHRVAAMDVAHEGATVHLKGLLS